MPLISLSRAVLIANLLPLQSQTTVINFTVNNKQMLNMSYKQIVSYILLSLRVSLSLIS